MDSRQKLHGITFKKNISGDPRGGPVPLGAQGAYQNILKQSYFNVVVSLLQRLMVRKVRL